MESQGKLAANAIDDEIGNQLSFCFPLGDCSPLVGFDISKDLGAWVSHRDLGGNVFIFITSGGTSVPLEKRCVRSLENFSTGRRGATLAEEFLKRGYNVIFLTRERSLQPYEQRLDMRDLLADFEFQVEAVRSTAAQYQKVRANLFTVYFDTLAKYLQYVRVILRTLRELDKRLIAIFGAAVSDFYVSPSNMSEHKIQSDAIGNAGLTLQLSKTPKLLALYRRLTPEAFFVSFKLETDETILTRKCIDAMRTKGVNMVVGNCLENRRTDLIIVEKADRGGESVTRILSDEGKKIEEALAKEIVRCYSAHTYVKDKAITT